MIFGLSIFLYITSQPFHLHFCLKWATFGPFVYLHYGIRFILLSKWLKAQNFHSLTKKIIQPTKSSPKFQQEILAAIKINFCSHCTHFTAIRSYIMALSGKLWNHDFSEHAFCELEKFWKVLCLSLLHSKTNRNPTETSMRNCWKQILSDVPNVKNLEMFYKDNYIYTKILNLKK
jgi:hypothetical protein